MRLQPFQRPNPIAAALQGLTQIVQQQNQAKTQEYLLRRQMQQEQYERQRQEALDAQRQEEREYQRGRDRTQDERMLNFGMAQDVPDPEDFENPAPLSNLRMQLRQGLVPKGRPDQTFNLPGIGAPMGGGALPFTLPAAGPVQTALGQAGRRVQDVRNEALQNAIAARARETQAEMTARAREVEDERTRRAELIAGIKARSEAEKEGLKADTAEGRAFLQTYSSTFAQMLKEYPANPEIAHETAISVARQGMQGFKRTPAPGPGLVPSLPGDAPEPISSRKVGVQETNADTNAFRADEQARRNQATEKLNREKFEFDKSKFGQEFAEKARRNRELERLNREKEARLRTAGATGGSGGAAAAGGRISPADDKELISLRGQIERGERELIDLRKRALQSPEAKALLPVREQALANYLARQKEILDRYQPKVTVSPLPPAPTAAPSRSALAKTRDVRLKHVQQFRERYGREPSAKEVNDIADAVRRGLLK